LPEQVSRRAGPVLVTGAGRRRCRRQECRRPNAGSTAPAGARRQARGTECVRIDRAAQLCRSRRMEFDDQMRRFFGTDDLGNVSPEAMASGIERMQVEFGLETDKGRRFAMWSLLYMLGAAPDLDTAFEDAGDRDAARRFMDLLDEVNAGEDN